jgi:transposase
MFYLGIDQHRKQLTINLRNEAGDVVLRRQVSTDWRNAREFLDQLAAQTSGDGGYVTIVEVCGFNDWLLKLLAGEPTCRRTLLVQAEQRAPHKTDRRDANRLCELLWTNRERLLAGKKVQQLRVIASPNESDAQARQLTALWRRATRQRTRTINAIHHLLLKHNIQQTCPTKGIKTKAARAWLAKLKLPTTDRLEMDLLLDQWLLWDRQCEQLDQQVKLQQRQHAGALLLASVPGCAAFSSLALACRVGDIRRFAGPQSLANYWGLTPVGTARAEARRADASLVQADQEPPRLEDRPGGRDAPADDDLLAHAATRSALSIARAVPAISHGRSAASMRNAHAVAADLSSGSTKGGRPFRLRPRLDLRLGEGRGEGEGGRG